jgi:hypothetical protein
MTLYELDEAATLSRWDLHVGNLTKALEERTKFIFGDVSRETSDEDGGVVRVSELVHGLRGTIVTEWRRSTH